MAGTTTAHRPAVVLNANANPDSSSELDNISAALDVEPANAPAGVRAAGDFLHYLSDNASCVGTQHPPSLGGSPTFHPPSQPPTAHTHKPDLLTRAAHDDGSDELVTACDHSQTRNPIRGIRQRARSMESTDSPALRQALRDRPPSVVSTTSDSGAPATTNNQQKQARDAESIKVSQVIYGLNDMRLNGAGLATAKLAALTSPCFFHKRFVDAVDFERVLEEIQGDEGMSHSKLMQTAHGVREVARQLQRRPIKRAVKTVLIVTKARDNDLVLLTRELTEWLLSTPRYGSEVGVNVYVDAKLRRSKRFGAAELIARDPRYDSMLRYWTPDLCWDTPEKIDLVLTLGGDGTVLYTSWLFQRIVPPILSFSLGSLGFLTNFEYDNFRQNLDSIMGDSGMRVNLRMRFTCTVYRANHTRRGTQTDSMEVEKFEVLNELVIDRGPSPYVSNLELYGDGHLLTVVQADGCIFSTPTGSTAYSLSAGGALVHPDIPAILLTPICPHTLSFRPMLLNDTMSLRVCVPKSSRGGAWCSFDGKGRVELHPGDAVTIAASQYPFPTVLSNQMEWFDSISRTLRWNTRGATQKGWTARTGEEEAGEQAEAERQEDEFDIDFDELEESAARDSGYSGTETSSVQDGASPIRGMSGALLHS